MTTDTNIVSPFVRGVLPNVVETAAQQRARVIRENLGNPTFTIANYDDAVALGYEPESWDGIYKIAAVEFPILWLTRRYALVREVIEIPGTHTAARDRHGRERRRWVLRRVPAEHPTTHNRTRARRP